MLKNTADQKWIVFAFDATTSLPKTGDAAQITANLRKDYGDAGATTDQNPTELEDGFYAFDMAQAETNADHLLLCPASSTENIVVVACPAVIFTEPVGRKYPATLAVADVSGNLPAEVKAQDNIDFGALQKASIKTQAQDGLATVVRAAVGMESANLDTQIAGLPTDADVQTAAAAALTAYDPPTKAELDSAVEPLATSAALATVDGIVDSILEDTGTTLDTLIKDIPTVAEFEARTLVAADYVVEGDTIAGVTTVTNLTNAPTAGDFTATMKASITSAVPTVALIAAGVWNYLTSAMTTTGSIGKRIADWFSGYVEGAVAEYTATDVAICSRALQTLGNEAIENLTDDTKAVNLCNRFYVSTLKETLRAYSWNCAIEYSDALTETTTPTFGYSYAFTLPADCLRVLGMPYDEEYQVVGKTLQCNSSSAKIKYIKLIAASVMDELLQGAIAARLAATIAFSLTNSNSAATAMWQLYKDKLDEAQSIDAFEGTPPQMGSNDWINSRR